MGGKGGGGSSSQTVTQKADPWSGIQPQLQQAANDTQSLYNSGALNFSYYPNSTVSPQSDYTKQAMDLTAQRALNGSPVTTAANAQLTDTINGKYLDPQSNPYFQGALNNIADAYARGTAANTDSAFNRSGAFGGSAYNETKGANNQAFANSLNDLGNTQYQQARQQQLAATALAPQAASQDYANLSALSNVGSNQDAYNQNVLNADIAKYDYNQQAPVNAIQNYTSLLNGVGGNLKSTSTTSPYQQQNNLGLGLGALANVGGASGLLSSLVPSTTSLMNMGAPAAAVNLAAKFSDIRLKDNICLVDFENGYPIYNFTYKNDPKKVKYRGVMAQDVYDKEPDAIDIYEGFMMVDYAKIGINFIALQ